MSVEPFHVRLAVRNYDLDMQRHVNGAIYLQYADHARWECLRAAGVSADALLAGGLGPVNLETSIRYRNELRAEDEVDVSCVFVWGEGKTLRVEQVLQRAEGAVAAEVSSLSGLLDLETRRLVPNPARHWHSRAARPELLGL
jgi:acyl-CoA thioester hydrolase